MHSELKYFLVLVVLELSCYMKHKNVSRSYEPERVVSGALVRFRKVWTLVRDSVSQSDRQHVNKSALLGMACLDVAISKSVDGRGMNHWSLHLFTESTKGTVYEAGGDPEVYFLNVIEEHDPRTDPIHWKSIPIYDCFSTDEVMEVDRILKTISVDNESYNFNCQVWVFDALEKLNEEGLIPDYEYAEAYEMLMALTYDTHGEHDDEE